jgi:predicted nuclease with TOPRIM domain
MSDVQYAERPVGEDGEVTKVLESLVADHEDLKRGNTELQSLLQESRDDVRALQQEVEELRATQPPTNREYGVNTSARRVLNTPHS